MQSLIRLLLLEQSDRGLHCLNLAYLQTFRVNNGIIFHMLVYLFNQEDESRRRRTSSEAEGGKTKKRKSRADDT